MINDNTHMIILTQLNSKYYRGSQHNLWLLLVMQENLLSFYVIYINIK